MTSIPGSGWGMPLAGGTPRIRFAARRAGQDYAFFRDRDSAYHQLAHRMRSQNGDAPLMEQLLGAVVKAKNPEQTAAMLLEKYGDALQSQPLDEIFPGLEPLLHRSAKKGLDDDALALLELMSLLADSNETHGGRKLIQGFMEALVQKPNAGQIARNILAQFDTEMAENPLSRLYLKVRSFVKEKHHVELLAMEDFLTAAGELGLTEERQLLVDLIRLEHQERNPNRTLLELAGKKLLEGLEKEADYLVSRQPEAFFAAMILPQNGPGHVKALAEAKALWQSKQKAALALGVIESFRQAATQPPDDVLSPLLEAVEATQSRNAFYRGKGIPARYTGAVFAPEWEARYIKAILPFNWHLDYGIDLLEHHALESEAGQEAQRHLIRLLKEPAFDWEFTHEGGAVETIGTLGRLVRAVVKSPQAEHSLIYPVLREKILSLAGAETATAGSKPAARPASLLPAPLIAKLAVDTWLDQWPPGETLPDDLMLPLLSKASLHEDAPEASQEELPKPKPRPVYTEDSPSRPAKKRKKRPSLLDILLGRA